MARADEDQFDRELEAHGVRVKDADAFKVRDDVFDEVTLLALYRLVHRKRLSAIDRRNLALALVDRKKPATCALAGFYILLAGDGKDRAERYLESAGDKADDVRAAFK